MILRANPIELTCTLLWRTVFRPNIRLKPPSWLKLNSAPRLLLLRARSRSLLLLLPRVAPLSVSLLLLRPHPDSIEVVTVKAAGADRKQEDGLLWQLLLLLWDCWCTVWRALRLALVLLPCLLATPLVFLPSPLPCLPLSLLVGLLLLLLLLLPRSAS